MTFRVELTHRARRDLASLYERINAAESSTAARWFNGLEESIYGLARLPRRCPVAPEAKKARRSLRHLLYGNNPHIYRAIYEIDEASQVIYVLTIRHGAMDHARLEELS